MLHPFRKRVLASLLFAVGACGKVQPTRAGQGTTLASASARNVSSNAAFDAGAAGADVDSSEQLDRPSFVVILARDTRGRSTANLARLSAMGMTFGSGQRAPDCAPSSVDQSGIIARTLQAHDAAYATARFATGDDDAPRPIRGVARRAHAFIAQQAAAKRPFYLQIASCTPMAENMDAIVGGVLDTLRDPNGDGDDADSLLATTYVLLFSDHASLAAGPGITAGTRSAVTITESDLLPTIAEWAGATPAASDGLDGGSFARITRGTSAVLLRRRNAPVEH